MTPPRRSTKEVTASGIQGRGGAAFPVGRKWGVVNLNDGQPHYLCANADEGEPGTFKDRWILENAPHLLVESMLIAAYALQVRHAFVYIRGEFDLPYRRLAAARRGGATRRAISASGILGTDFACDLVVYRGAGSYVCGEASALLTSLEGKQRLSAQPAAAPHGARPLPAADRRQQRRDARQHRRHRRATAREAFRKVGTAKNPGTRLISISGHIARPGVYEIEFGYPWSQVHPRGLRRRARRPPLKAIIPGGISTKVLTGGRDRAAHLDNQAGRGRRLVAGLGRHDRRSPKARAWCACCR